MKFRTFIFATLSILTLLASLGCTSSLQNSPNTPAMSGVDLAAAESDQTVSLVTDIVELDPNHHSMCTAVWVGRKTIMTAAHCAEGNVEAQRALLIYQALVKNGYDPQIARKLIALGLDDIDDDNPFFPDIVKNAAAIARTIHAPPIMGSRIAYIVKSEVTDIDTAPTTLHQGIVTAYNDKYDLALIEVRGPIPPHTVITLAEHAPPVGARVSITGHVYGNWWFFRTGEVGAYRHSLLKHAGVAGKFMEVSIPMSHGDSGGGIFDDHGHLIGIADLASNAVPGGYCIHLDTIRSFLLGARLISVNIDSPASKDPPLSEDSASSSP
jgi:hypothetical protein